MGEVLHYVEYFNRYKLFGKVLYRVKTDKILVFSDESDFFLPVFLFRHVGSCLKCRFTTEVQPVVKPY